MALKASHMPHTNNVKNVPTFTFTSSLMIAIGENGTAFYSTTGIEFQLQDITQLASTYTSSGSIHQLISHHTSLLGESRAFRGSLSEQCRVQWEVTGAVWVSNAEYSGRLLVYLNMLHVTLLRESRAFRGSLSEQCRVQWEVTGAVWASNAEYSGRLLGQSEWAMQSTVGGYWGSRELYTANTGIYIAMWGV